MTIINGVSEERVRAIFAEQKEIARKEYTEDAYRIADERVSKFEERFMPKMIEVDNSLQAFSDPAFQFLLRHAQQTAAGTEREADYDLLTELLSFHIQKGNDRKNRAGISRAVEIVGEIDNDALCALTVSYALMQFTPVTGQVFEGLSVLDSIFSKLLYQELPTGNDWMDHLDVLGAIRISSIGNMKKIEEYLPDILNGYVCVGIKADSDEFKNASLLLANAGINSNLLVKNELLDGYFRLALTNENSINNLGFNTGTARKLLDDGQKGALKRIWSLYSKDGSLRKQVKEKFFEIWNSYVSLKTIHFWWDSIPQAFSVTSVGRVLAQTNAKRCDPRIPDIE